MRLIWTALAEKKPLMNVYRDQPAPLCPGVPWGLPWVPKGRLKIRLVQISFFDRLIWTAIVEKRR
jgi:hypothetical protein